MDDLSWHVKQVRPTQRFKTSDPKQFGSSRWLRFFIASLSFAFIYIAAPTAHAASLSMNPAGGTFTVGSTFDVSLFLNTENASVNAIGTFISFPPDLLQLVSAVVSGESVVQVWSAQPKFNNQTGSIELQGGIPGGLNTSRGLVTTLRFRVKSVGSALVKFLDASKVLLNDGRGTDVLNDTSNGLYTLVLPPPAGPQVVSETHPEQTVWYAASDVVLSWAAEPDVEGYSYILTKEPADIPDDISEGVKRTVTYRDVADGVNYFHIKGLRDGEWGGTTHFAVKVDTTPPAEFPIEIAPGARTVRRQPIVEFATTDALSGISHYELKLVPLKLQEQGAALQTGGSETLFIETQSPYLTPELPFGTYHVIVRAYDRAGNFREVTQPLAVVRALFRFVGNDGLELKNTLIIDWPLVYAIGALLAALLGYFGLRLRRWHVRLNLQRAKRELPRQLEEQLRELKAYRNKYGKLAVFLLVAWLTIWRAPIVEAQTLSFPPPHVTMLSRNISNEEIFYIGGQTDSPNIEVHIFVQNTESGETLGALVLSNQRGEWFYRHDSFLPAGDYRLWVQGKMNEQLSPPSPEVRMVVQRTAFQFGASRLSLETLYLLAFMFVLVVVVGLAVYLVSHAIAGRKKHKLLMKEIVEAEASVRRGFAVLRRDIEAELDLIKRAKLEGELSSQERGKEAQLMSDLSSVEKYISKEIWDIDELEQT